MCYDNLKKSFSSLPPMTSFWLGFVGAVLVLCTAGFLIMMGMVMKGKLVTAGTVAARGVVAVNNNAAAQPTDTNPTTAPTAAANNNDLTGPVGQFKAVSSADHVRGDSGAKVTMIEYSDFECPYCKNFDATMQQVMTAYKGKVKWVYRHYPLSFHANAEKEAEASECAAELGGNNAFWQFADKVYARTTSNGTGFALADLPKLAKEIGLDQAKFQTCLDSGKYKDFVAQQENDGAGAGIQGTPGTILIDSKGGAKLIKGALPMELLKPLIDAALK